MKPRRCPNCDCPIAARDVICERCGADTSTIQPHLVRWMVLLGLAYFVANLLAIV
ncbi:MAG: hypothetical protein Tsb0020_44850 [Haliangiales bacterium]